MPLGTEVDLGPGHIVIDGDPVPPTAKGAQQPPSFWPMFIMATVAISATTELLFSLRIFFAGRLLLHVKPAVTTSAAIFDYN